MGFQVKPPVDCFLTCYLLNILNQSLLSCGAQHNFFFLNNRLFCTLKWKSCERQLETVTVVVVLTHWPQVRVLLCQKSSPKPGAKKSPDLLTMHTLPFLPSAPLLFSKLSLINSYFSAWSHVHQGPQVSGIIIMNRVYLQ